MGFPDPDSGCRRHPNQKRLPGVCSFCLRERLSKISSGNYSYKTADSTISGSSSLPSSPPYSAGDKGQSRHRLNHRRHGSDFAGPLGFVIHQGSSNGRDEVNVGSGLKKSRSVVCAPRIYRGGDGDGDGGGEDEKEKSGKSGKKGGGFWKKLIRSTSKKTKGVLMHSMTVKERSHDNNSSSRKF